MNKRIIVIIVAVVLIALFFVLDLGRYLSLVSLKEHRETLSIMYQEHQAWVIGMFIMIYILQTALSLPGAAILSMAAGALFGVVTGTIVVNIAATTGAVCAFVIARYLFRDAIKRRFGARLGKINAELEQRGMNYLLFLRLVPLVPFFLTNLAASLTSLPLRTFFFGTLIGIIPGSFVFCNAGASLAAVSSMHDILSFRVLSSFTLLGAFAIVPVIYAKLKKKG